MRMNASAARDGARVPPGFDATYWIVQRSVHARHRAPVRRSGAAEPRHEVPGRGLVEVGDRGGGSAHAGGRYGGQHPAVLDHEHHAPGRAGLPGRWRRAGRDSGRSAAPPSTRCAGRRGGCPPRAGWRHPGRREGPRSACRPPSRPSSSPPAAPVVGHHGRARLRDDGDGAGEVRRGREGRHAGRCGTSAPASPIRRSTSRPRGMRRPAARASYAPGSACARSWVAHPTLSRSRTDFGIAGRVRYPRPVVRPAVRRAPVAQRIEHLTTDQKVWGSNPYGRAERSRRQPPR